jgi:hypothetical protein
VQVLVQRLHPARGEVAAGVAKLLGKTTHQTIGLVVVATRGVPGTVVTEYALFAMKSALLAIVGHS